MGIFKVLATGLLSILCVSTLLLAASSPGGAPQVTPISPIDEPNFNLTGRLMLSDPLIVQTPYIFPLVATNATGAGLAGLGEHRIEYPTVSLVYQFLIQTGLDLSSFQLECILINTRSNQTTTFTLNRVGEFEGAAVYRGGPEAPFVSDGHFYVILAVHGGGLSDYYGVPTWILINGGILTGNSVTTPETPATENPANPDPAPQKKGICGGLIAGGTESSLGFTAVIVLCVSFVLFFRRQIKRAA